jgi:hypothetical protein
MEIEIIRQLAAVPPPGQRWKFRSVKDANAEIVRRENLLGVEHGPAFTNIAEANLRVQLLEKLLAAKVATPPAAPAPIVAPVPAAKPQLHGLARAVAATRIPGVPRDTAIRTNLHGLARAVAATKLQYKTKKS